jgi:hydrogenase expression/formation protein HypC
MCLAIPSKIIEIDKLTSTATIDVYGARREANLTLMPEEVNIGEYVLVHAGFAIQKVDEDAAEDALKLIKEMSELLEAEDPDGEFC